MTATLPEGQAPSLNVRSVPWASLKPHPLNPNNGDVEAIGESVDANGVYRPIIVANEGTIIAGHHLYYVLGDRGVENVDAVILPVDPMSDRALRIMAADNRTASLSRTDDALMVELLSVLTESEGGLLGTAYTDDDLSEIQAAMRRAEHTPLNYAGSSGNAEIPPTPGPAGDRATSADGRPTDGMTQHDFASAATRYETKGVRYLMLEYPTSVYPDVVEKLGEARENAGLASNADTLLHLLGIPIPTEATA